MQFNDLGMLELFLSSSRLCVLDSSVCGHKVEREASDMFPCICSGAPFDRGQWHDPRVSIQLVHSSLLLLERSRPVQSGIGLWSGLILGIGCPEGICVDEFQVWVSQEECGALKSLMAPWAGRSSCD